jgi:hypothetical protein
MKCASSGRNSALDKVLHVIVQRERGLPPSGGLLVMLGEYGARFEMIEERSTDLKIPIPHIISRCNQL